MSAFKTQVIDNHVSVQAAAELTGYNIQFLRRLLRARKLEAVRIGQVWLISVVSLETSVLRHTTVADRRCGLKQPEMRKLSSIVNTPRLHMYTVEDQEVQT